MNAPTFTSGQILTELSNDNCHLFEDAQCSHGYLDYVLTDGEQCWLDFVRGRYSIADYIDEQTIDGVTRIYFDEMSAELDHDNGNSGGKAACLSENTALAAIFFYCYIEDCDCSCEHCNQH